MQEHARLCWIKVKYISLYNTLHDTCSFLGLRHHVCYLTTTCHPQMVDHHAQNQLPVHRNPMLCQQASCTLSRSHTSMNLNHSATHTAHAFLFFFPSLVDKGWVFGRSTASCDHSHGNWLHRAIPKWMSCGVSTFRTQDVATASTDLVPSHYGLGKYISRHFLGKKAYRVPGMESLGMSFTMAILLSERLLSARIS